MAFTSTAFAKLRVALKKTAKILATDIRPLFAAGRQINEEFLHEVEVILLAGDVKTANRKRIVDTIRDRWRAGEIRNADECLSIVREVLSIED